MIISRKTLKIIIAIAASTGIFCLAFWAVTYTASRTIYKKNNVTELKNNNFQNNSGANFKGEISMPVLQTLTDSIKNTNQTGTNTMQTAVLNGFSDTVPILMYHYIEVAPASTTLKGLYLDPKIFDNQLQELKKNNYQTLFVSEVASNIINKNKVAQNNIVLTFDDGYEDFYSEAYPILKKYNFKATLYVIINALGTKGYLTKSQVRELADSGLVEIASHTFNHPDLRNLKDKDARFEIMASKKVLEQISGKPVLSFAYPFGLYKPEFFTIASSTGYTSAVSVMAGTRQGTGNQWLLRRLRPNERSGATFIAWIKSWEKSKY